MECPWTGWLVVGCVYFSCLFASALIGATVYDLYALRQNPPWRRVSGDILRIGNRYTVIAFIAACGLACIVGMLIGHFWLNQDLNP